MYLDGTKVADVTGTSATLTGLTENTSYTVTVRAKDNEGALSDSSDPVVFQTTQHVNSAPSAPANVAVANVTETTADVSWDPSTDSDGTIAGYEVYLDGTKVADASGTTVTKCSSDSS